MLFFQFIFGLIAAVVLCAVGIVAFLVLKVKRMASRFSAADFSQGTAPHGRQQGAANRTARRGDSGVVEEELYDERSPREAEKKIFSKDEGEYVDYEDV